MSARSSGRLGRSVALAVVVTIAGALTGCALFDDKESEPVETRIPTEPPADADLLCGMDRASVETAVGFEIERVEGDLTDEEGCLLWPQEGSGLRDWALSARVADMAADDVRRWREVVDGTQVSGVRPPDVRFEDVLGGGWRDDLGSPPTGLEGGMSVVFGRDRAVVVLGARSAEGRDAIVDLRALAQQVAASAGVTLEQVRE